MTASNGAPSRDTAVSDSTLVNVQSLAQRVAYLFSDKVFTYSPESFQLDDEVQKWSAGQQSNAFGQVPDVQIMQTRAGAGTIALGYVFSPDFDLTKRHVPQSVIASSGALVPMREALSQLSLLHELANPFVAHVAAVDYVGSQGLVTDYVSPMQSADDLGFGLIGSLSSGDAQHMALLATAFATTLPTIHAYDGLNARNAVSADRLSDESSLKQAYEAIVKQLGATEAKHSDREGKALRAISALNNVLGTKYKAFEYRGHPQAESVLVTFGSAEALVAGQIVEFLAAKHIKVGTVNVRLYRPFIEEEFLRVLPKTNSTVQVLGQVEDQSQVLDASTHSKLYQDVLATLTVATIDQASTAVTEHKYDRAQTISHEFILDLFSGLTAESVAAEDIALQSSSETQIAIWTLDDSAVSAGLAGFVPTVAQLLGSRVHSRIAHDNLVQGGVTRAEITVGPNVSANYVPLSSANVAYIGSDKLLQEFNNVLDTIRFGGTLILSLPGVKPDDLEKKIPASVRQVIKARNIRLQILDPSASSVVGSDGAIEALLVQLTILHAIEQAATKAQANRVFGSQEQKIIDELEKELDTVLRNVEIPNGWADAEEEESKAEIVPKFAYNSFVPYKKEDEEAASRLDNWIIAAKGAVFKEAYGTTTALRPDAGVKTSVVTVKEHRRLTPMSYDRNVFHIEFDLGSSGLTYAIGEALGIHAENESQEVMDFIKWYGLDADEVAQVPSRDDPSILENRTVYQALKQNVDMFGRPPKRFYEALAEFANEEEQKSLRLLSQPEGATEFKRRAEVDTITFADVLIEFPSAHPSFDELVRIVSPLKRREYSIASSQHVTPTSVALLIVTVNWQDPTGRDRFGLATRFLNSLKVGAPVTVSVKPSVMKLPQKSTAPIIMAGLGTGLAPFRAFVQERAYQKQVLGLEIGSVLLYLGSRHQREEYLYGEEWEAYRSAGIVTLIGAAFSRDQPQKIYIQDRMRQTMDDIRQAYLKEEGSFYLCGPTWPVPDVTEVLQEAVEVEAKAGGAKKVDSRREIETLKDDGRFVLEVY